MYSYFYEIPALKYEHWQFDVAINGEICCFRIGTQFLMLLFWRSYGRQSVFALLKCGTLVINSDSSMSVDTIN